MTADGRGNGRYLDLASPLRSTELEGRSDDTPETIRHRMEVYRQSTQPLIDYYGARRILVEVDGVGTVDEVAKRIEEAEHKFAEALYVTAYARKEALKSINRVLNEEINVEDVVKDELERRPKLMRELTSIKRKVSSSASASVKNCARDSSTSGPCTSSWYNACIVSSLALVLLSILMAPATPRGCSGYLVRADAPLRPG